MSKSVKTTKSNSTRKSGGLNIEEDLDVKAAKFIDEKLPEFFGVKAAHHQASVIKGRNPKSLPKDSELWLYSKISTRRKNMIERGRGLWDVVDEVSLEKSHAETLKKEQRHRSPNKSNTPSDDEAEEEFRNNITRNSNNRQQLRKGSELENGPSRAASPTKSFGATTSMHMTGQIKAVMQNKASALDLRVNFKTKAPVAYGNTFLIMNYNDDVLYMHNISKEGETPIYELRTKPLSKIESTDRVKFKALDLNNPSNPKAIRFGDNVWFQCIVDEDNTNLMSGFVMTSKVFEPPNLQSVRIDYRSVAEENNNSANTASGASSGIASGETINGNKSNVGKKSCNRRRSVVSNTASTSALPSLYTSTSSTTSSPSKDMGNRNNSAPSLSTQSTESSTIDKELLATTQTEKVAMALGVLGARKEKEVTEEESKIAKICGYLQVNRIADNPRGYEGQPPPENANALKNSMRYNTRQTMVLGKWTFNDALRPDQRNDPDDKKHRHQHSSATGRDKDKSRGRHTETDDPSSNGSNIAALERSGVLTSLTPIVIQQDAYCLSFAPPTEITKWPLTSFDILKKNVKQRPSAMPLPSSPLSNHNKGKGINNLNNLNGSSSTDFGSSGTSLSATAASFLPPMHTGGASTRGRRSLSPSFSVSSASINNNNNGLGSTLDVGTASLTGNGTNSSNNSQNNNQASTSFTAANASAAYVDELNLRYIKHLEHLKKGGILPSRLESVIIKEKAVGHDTTGDTPTSSALTSSSSSSSSLHHNELGQQHANFGILRRIVSRKAPYDFAVDRRCVWKLCVFEEFTDNFMEMSSKEKHAKAVMETATMTLKISKMNREGATVHIPKDETADLPALCGGENFPRILREITFRTNQRAEQEYLRARRIREYKLSQYFTAMIPQVLEKEEQTALYRPSTASTIATNSSSGSEEEEEEGEEFVGGEDETDAGESRTSETKRNRQKQQQQQQQGTLQRTNSQLSVMSATRKKAKRHKRRKRSPLGAQKSSSTLLFLTEAEQVALSRDEQDEDEQDENRFGNKQRLLMSLNNNNHNNTQGGAVGGGLVPEDNRSDAASISGGLRVNIHDENNSMQLQQQQLQHQQQQQQQQHQQRVTNPIVKPKTSKSRYYDNGMYEVKESIHHAVKTMKSISAAEVEDPLSRTGSTDLLLLGNPRHKSLAVQDALVQAKAGSPRGILLSQARAGGVDSIAGTPTHHHSNRPPPSSSHPPGGGASVTSHPQTTQPFLMNHHHPAGETAFNSSSSAVSHTTAHHPSNPHQLHPHHQHQPHHHLHHQHQHHHHHNTHVSSQPHHSNHKHGLSREIQAVFNTKVKVPNKDDMILTNTDKVLHFNDFSSGEQIMSLHRTMNFYNKLANLRTEQAMLAEKQPLQPVLLTGKTTTNGVGGVSSNNGVSNGTLDTSTLRRQSTQPHMTMVTSRKLSTSSMLSSSNNNINNINNSSSGDVMGMGGVSHASSANPLTATTAVAVTAGGSGGSGGSGGAATNGGANPSSSSSNNRKAAPVPPGVLAKLEKLQREDANIVAALNYKQAVERNPMSDIEQRSYANT